MYNRRIIMIRTELILRENSEETVFDILNECLPNETGFYKLLLHYQDVSVVVETPLVNLRDLKRYAKILSKLDDDQSKLYITIAPVIDITQVDPYDTEYDIFPELKTVEDLGRFVVEETDTFSEAAIEELGEFIDYSKVGQAVLDNTETYIGPFGVIKHK